MRPARQVSPEPDFSTNAETPATVETSQAPLTTDQLLTIIANMQKQIADAQALAAEAQRESNAATKALADAVLETTKPKEYIKTKKELADEANQKLFDDRQRELQKRQKAVTKAEQDSCDHIAGGSPLSEQRDIAGRTSILWHRNDVGVDVGICTVCQRIFRPTDTDFAIWRKKPSFNRLSASGYRTVLDPVRARAESFLHDS